MTFARPEWLWAGLPFCAVLAWVLLIRHRHATALAAAVGRAEASRLWPQGRPQFPFARGAALALAVVALLLAAAGPGLRHGAAQTRPTPLALTTIVDISPSMAASDVAPSRIERAGEALRVLAGEMPPGQWTLIAAGDWPATLLPTTDDARVVDWFSRSLSPRLVAELAAGIRTGRGDDGTSLERMLAAARAVSAGGTSGSRQVVLVVSDGAQSGEPAAIQDEVEKLRESGVTVWTAGVGRRAGTAIELQGRPFVTGDGGAVRAGLDFTGLRSLAQKGGGTFHEFNDAGGVEDLVSDLRKQAGQVRADDSGPRTAQRWLLLVALVLLAFERGADVMQRRTAGAQA